MMKPRIYRPHGYQDKAIEFLATHNSGALFLDPGMGKTSITLTALSRLLFTFDIGKPLIVAPLRVVESVWRQEAAKWAHTQHLTFSLVTGSPKQRLKALFAEADIYLINYENLPWLLKQKTVFDAVIFDEASKMKSPRAQRFKAFKRARHWVERVWLLTGTPASNGLLDVWALAFLMDWGKRLGRTFSWYRDAYFTADYHGYNWTIRDGAEAEIYEQLQDICLTMSAADYLDLPNCTMRVVDIDMPDDAKAGYQELEREYLLQIEDETIVIGHAASLANKLLQYANGAIYTDDQHNWIAVHDAKIRALRDLVDETYGKPLLVAYNYRTDAERIKKAFPNAVVLGDDPDMIDQWNRGEIPMLLAHPASAGHGLNLQDGGSHIVWFGLTWSLELYLQFNARLDRQGQKEPVTVHHLVVQGAIDQTVMEALQRKDTTQRALLTALKDDIAERIAV